MSEGVLDTEMLWILLAQDALDLRLIVETIVNDLRGHHLAPAGDKLESL